MNDARSELYSAMGNERVNVEIMFPRSDEQDPVISCRLREWSAGRNAGRMILAGGRTVDEAIGYAYSGLCDNEWVPIEWRVRAVGVGVVHTVTGIQVPVRKPIRLSELVSPDEDWDPMPPSETPISVPQNGAHDGPRRNSSKDKG